MTSNLSAFPFIQERSEATPGLFNAIFSILSANDAALNSNLTLSPPSGATLSLFSHLSISNRLAIGEKAHIGPAVSTSTNRTALLTLVGNMSNAGSGGTDYIYFNDSSAGKTSWLLGSGVGDAQDSLTFFNLSQSTPVVKLLPTSLQILGTTPTSGALSINEPANIGGIVINQSGTGEQSSALLIQGGFLLGAAQPPLVNLRQVWNTTGAPQGWLLDITNTVSSISAKVVDVKINSTDQFTIGTDGDITIQGSTNTRSHSLSIVSFVGLTVCDVSGNVPVRANALLSDEVGLYIRKYGVIPAIVTPRIIGGINGTSSIRFSFTTTNSGDMLGAEFMAECLGLASGGSFLGTMHGVLGHAEVGGTGNLSVIDTMLGVHGQIGFFSAGSSNYTVMKAVSVLARSPSATNIGTIKSSYGIFTDGTLGVGNWPALGSSIGTPGVSINPGGTVVITGAGDTTPLSIVGPTQSTAANVITASTVWNNVATTFLGFVLNVVETAYGANSRLMSLQSGGVEKFGVAPTGALAIAAGTNGATMLTIGAADGTNNYSMLDGLRVGGDDVANTLYNATRNIAVTRDSGGTIFVGQVSSSITGMAVNTATGASVVSGGKAILPTYTFMSDQSLGWYRSGAQTIAQSLGTLNLADNAVRLSMRTLAASSLTASAANTNVAVNEVVVTVQASGASFAINSGGTTWIFHSDASAKNT